VRIRPQAGKVARVGVGHAHLRPRGQRPARRSRQGRCPDTPRRLSVYPRMPLPCLRYIYCTWLSQGQAIDPARTAVRVNDVSTAHFAADIAAAVRPSPLRAHPSNYSTRPGSRPSARSSSRRCTRPRTSTASRRPSRPGRRSTSSRASRARARCGASAPSRAGARPRAVRCACPRCW
jgi:hypothetical protein